MRGTARTRNWLRPRDQVPATGIAPEAGTDCLAQRCPHHGKLRRLHRDLHDQVGSSLAGITMQIEVVQQLFSADPDEANRLLADVHAEATTLVAQLRSIVSDTKGWMHVGNNVGPAVRAMAERMSRVVGDDLRISVRVDDAVHQVDHEIGSAAFWIVREALTNMLKHSNAGSCEVSLLVRDGELQIWVVDDGVGLPLPRQGDAGGSGLDIMRERAAERGGWCIARPAIPSGFQVIAAIPLPGSDREPCEYLMESESW